MEGMFLDPQYLSVLGSLIAGSLLLVMVLAAVVYGWAQGKPTHAAAEREPLKRAA